MSVTLTLPFPTRPLSPNFRAKHWSVKANAIATYREECWKVARDVKLLRGPLTDSVTATVTFYVADQRRHDIDNLLASIKPAWDGMVDSGLMADDSEDKLRIVLNPVNRDKGKRCVKVELS